MSTPEIASDTQYVRALKLLPELMKASNLKKFDGEKIFKIFKYATKEKKITSRQYSSFVHYCKVYDKKLDNSIEFILED